MDWRDRITVDPQRCHGQAHIRGTRVPVAVILDNVADGVPTAEILASYPPLTEADVRAALEYAAELARERVVSLTPGSAA